MTPLLWWENHAWGPIYHGDRGHSGRGHPVLSTGPLESVLARAISTTGLFVGAHNARPNIPERMINSFATPEHDSTGLLGSVKTLNS